MGRVAAASLSCPLFSFMALRSRVFSVRRAVTAPVIISVILDELAWRGRRHGFIAEEL